MFLTWLLVGLAAIRVFYLVLHDPMFGYGNQFDMGRTAACLDLWPELPGGPRDTGYFEAPVESHRLIKIASQQCYPGIEAAFDTLAIHVDGVRRYFNGAPDRVDMRAIGALKALLLFAAAWCVHQALRRQPSAALLHAVILLIIIADPINTLYLNTLYGEFFAVLGAYLATAGIAAIAVNRVNGGTDVNPAHARQAEGWRILLLFSSGVLCLAFSRMQHVLLPIFFIALFCLLTPGYARGNDLLRGRAVTVVVMLLALATAASIVGNLRFSASNPVFHEVNRSNVLFGALLPSTENPQATVAALGLPPECALLSNSSYFRIAARGLKGSCPEALALSPLSLVRVFALQPQALAAVFGRGLLLSSGWRLSYLGEVAHGNFAKVAPGPLGIAASLGSLSRKLDFYGHVVFWLVPLWAGLMAGASLAYRRLVGRNAQTEGDSGVSDVALFCLAVIVISVWVSALFGDGYSELARHLHLGIVAAFAAWLLLLVVAVRQRPVVPIVLVSLLVLSSVMALRNLPLTMGALSEPADDRALVSARTDGAITLGGWVLAADHVVAVDLEQQQRLLQRVAVTPSPGLGRMHPMAGGSKPHEFRANQSDFQGAFDPQRAVELYAVRSNGERELIDIRYPCARMSGCR